MIKDLLKLFEGDPTQYLVTSLTGEVTERGKREADCVTLHEPVTEDIWENHINGIKRIGIRPEKGDQAKWGCIDIDPRNYSNYSSKKYIDLIKEANLPLVVTKSKSGGLHLFLFLKNWTPVKDILEVLNKWNNKYFDSDEVFPMNKAMNMPYFKADATTEHGYDDNGTPILLGKFIEIAKSKIKDIEDLKEFKLKEYEPEFEYNKFPPCIQNLIREKWSGNHRNDILFNAGILALKQHEHKLSKEELFNILKERNKQFFTNPLPENEIQTSLLKSLSSAKEYSFKCPPKYGVLSPICNKEVCKNRPLGIGAEAPDIVNDFKDITYSRDIKSIEYSFNLNDEFITVRPEDMADEKAWRKRLLNYKIYWKTLPKPRKGPSPFEMLMSHIVMNAVEDNESKWLDVLNEQQYDILKKFFEDHLEVDDFAKIKDGFVIMDSKTKNCYFKQVTLKKFLTGKKYFNTSKEAMKLLGCKKLEYHEGEKNVWCVEMPEFVEYNKIKTKPKQEENKISELDDEYHTGKFRT
jgi:hypothetical protein